MEMVMLKESELTEGNDAGCLMDDPRHQNFTKFFPSAQKLRRNLQADLNFRASRSSRVGSLHF
jgi:hypothetical protein